MPLPVGDRVLRGKFELIRRLISNSTGHGSSTWLALHEEEPFLIKLWPFDPAVGSHLQRALWDTELRTVYRVSSSPGAEDSLLVIRDAGLDQDKKCFVMVMEARGLDAGYDNLEDALKHRSSSNLSWLAQHCEKARESLWMGLRQIAQGIQLIHAQNTLHRDIGAQHVFFHPDSEPPHFRLSGFEWSIRIGELHTSEPPIGWAVPPEAFRSWDTFGFHLETDWYGFGMLAARCLINLEAYDKISPEKRNDAALERINRASERDLRDIEKQLLIRMIDRNHLERFTRGTDILHGIDAVLEAFRGSPASIEDRPLYLVYKPENVSEDLIDQTTMFGFVADPGAPHDPFNPSDLIQCTRLSRFIQEDLKHAQLFFLKENSNNFILAGDKLTLKMTRWGAFDKSTGKTEYSWDAAFIMDAWGLSQNEGGTEQRHLPPDSILVRTHKEILQSRHLLAEAQSWQRYLPYRDRGSEMASPLIRFHNFIRCTNQIDLLIRDAELFPYELVSYSREGGQETVVVKEGQRTRAILSAFELPGGLIEFLQRELESGAENCNLVALTSESEDALRLERGRKLDAQEFFEFDHDSLDTENKTITLRRVVIRNVCRPSDQGWLRTYGLFGQADLIRRRKEAIDRLSNHSYLLKSLATPERVYIDTEETKLPLKLPNEKVDRAKQAVIQDVLRTRPIYTLQGPPGTGKTTMVAWLLRQILEDDPVAQILITAQAHGAVDVLRAKVQDDAFENVDKINQPLTIRLGQVRKSDADLAEGSVEAESIRVLERSIEQLENTNLTPLQQKWITYAKNMCDAIPKHRFTGTETSQEFCELVKRGANITYCTTSAGDLEELARATQAYDWAIIEEAGKCHGFDLALPMQAGHRWLLIGDQHQLPPYRVEDYEKASTNLDRVVDALRNLPKRGGKLLDWEWLRHWELMSDEERAGFQNYVTHRIRTFEKLYDRCSQAPIPKEIRLTVGHSKGAIAGMITMQYRMHPTIGTLISKTYYRGLIQNETVNASGEPDEKVLLQIVEPEQISNVGIVWLDTPPCWENPQAGELGPEEGYPRYINPYEVRVVDGFLSTLQLGPSYVDQRDSEPLDLAVLSPYTQQVWQLRWNIRSPLPDGIVARKQLNVRQTRRSARDAQLVYTVDSFQGNEADIIIVSLVRNNDCSHHERPLGFLDEKPRMNVLFSRAQRLLVLVGSWEFFQRAVRHLELTDTDRKEWHIKQAVSLLAGWFDSGEAVRLDSAQFYRE